MMKKLSMKIVSFLKHKSLKFNLILLFLSIEFSTSVAQNYSSVLPFFQDTALLNIKIVAPFESIISDDCINPQNFQGSLIYFENGNERIIPVELKKRGKFRCNQENCSFPPLFIKFDKKKVKGSVFEGLNKIKLVNCCKIEDKKYETYVLKEYLVYRFFRQLSDTSFATRLLKVTYINSNQPENSMTRFAFVIEDDDDMAKRLNAKVIKASLVSTKDTDSSQRLLVEMFQYMIGNTDVSIPQSHNVEILITNPHQPLLVVPYDFDWSRMVNPPYAKPALEGKIKAQRQFLGECYSDTLLLSTARIFQKNEQNLLNTLRLFPYLSSKEKKVMEEHLINFYKNLDNQKTFFEVFKAPCHQ